jgi:hypothetical protein
MAIDDSDLGATVLGYAAGQKVFQRFTLKKMLGRGGMGVVWLAVDDKLEREVALKFLPEVMKSDRPAMEELKRETRRALDLTHSNIVRFYDFVENETTAAISMEYIPGDTLSSRRLAQPGQIFEPPALRRWVRQLCEALAYAHERGAVVHRDLKPANLLVDGHGDIKITDFGIARSISDSVSRISAQASTSGTPAYMSPQQMMGERPHPTDDIYSFGATLYELLTGKPPFYSGNIPAQVQSKVPPSVAARRKELEVTGGPVPPEWEAAIAACLAKDVKARPQTVRELAQRLGLPVATQTVSPFGDGTQATQPGGPPAPARRRWWPVALAAGLALAGAGYYIGVVMPQRAAAEQQRLAGLAHQAEDDRKARAEKAAAEEARKQLLARQQDEANKAEEARKAREQREATEARNALENFRRRVRNGEVPLPELRQIAQEQSPRGRMVRERLEELRNEQEANQLKTHGQILQLINGLEENAPKEVFADIEKQVRAYLDNAPDRLKTDVTRAWLRRQTAWKEYEAAHTPGSLTITTQPAGAMVTLLPRNERKPSPALFTDIAPGAVTLRVEREGFEPRDIMLTVKAGIETKTEPVRLVPLIGAANITSTPPGVRFTLELGNRQLEGVTPRQMNSLPQGRYRVTFQREGWEPVVRMMEVTKGGETALAADLRGATFDIRSTPPGGRVILNGHEMGVTPLTLTDMKFGDYRLDVLRDGYENYADKISATRDVALNIALTETPVTAAVRRLAARRWVSTSGARTELNFDHEGNVRGVQQGMFSGTRKVAGRVESYDAHNRRLTVVFTQGDPLTGRLPLQLLDDRSFKITVVTPLGFTNEISFTDGGAP